MVDTPSPDGPRIIEPVDFRRTVRAPRPRRRLGRWIGVLFSLLVIAALAAGGWFVLGGEQVELRFEPVPDHVELTGPPLQMELTDGYFLRPGAYVVRATREGYHPLEEEILVERGKDNVFEFTMQKLPGLVTFECASAIQLDLLLDDVEVIVDGYSIGRTPLIDIEIEPGPHDVRLMHARYQDLETDFVVEGEGRRQTLAESLRPDWAEVDLTTRPVTAMVLVDGMQLDTTPCRLELLSGTHVIELVADRFETWRREVDIVAEQPVAFTDIVLEPAKGKVLVQTSPPGAQVVVDGAYAGASPVEVDVPPDRDLLVQVARDGYTPDQRTVRVAPLERTTVAFDLALQTGVVRLVITPPDAQLSVDGTPWGEPTTEVILSAMEHRLEFAKEGYITEVRVVRPRPNVPERVVVELARVEPEASEMPKNSAAANGYALVLVEPGPFTMGASRREQGRRSNETLRNVRLERPFLIGEREVTNDEFDEFDPNHDSGLAGTVPLGSAQRPVVRVTWDDAARYCNWLSAQDGLPPAYEEKNGVMRAVDPMTTGYRLPTEAEWAYAARVTGGSDPLKYPWGAGYPPRATVGNFADASSSSILNRRIPDYDDGFAGTSPVASFAADDRGLYDMGGNVAEWCHDFYSTYTYDATRVEVDPTGPRAGQHHVVRGSSWRHSSISTLRCSYRDYCAADRDDLGFRICRYLNSPETDDD